MTKDCNTCLYKEGSCYPSTTIFDKDKTCKSYKPDYEGYIANLEKRIEELEKENAELKEENEKLEDDNDYLISELRVKALTNNGLIKENAELKAQNIKDCENFNKKMKEIKEQWNKEHYQLTKAKELLKEWIIYHGGTREFHSALQDKTEDFLKEA